MDVDNQYGVLELQKKLLTLLREFHSFCIDNDVKYSLDWGSLLGAVRHKGFIPWDDDLDIMVDRENYLKIKNRICGKLVYGFVPPNAPWVGQVFLSSDSAKASKPTMDVFIIDNAPDGVFSRKMRVMIIHVLQGMLKEKPRFNKGSIIYRIATALTYLFGKCIPRHVLVSCYDLVSQLSNRKGTKMKASYNTNFVDMPKLYSSSILDEYITVPFENIEVCITKNFHQTLIEKFGPDYMTPITNK